MTKERIIFALIVRFGSEFNNEGFCLWFCVLVEVIFPPITYRPYAIDYILYTFYNFVNFSDEKIKIGNKLQKFYQLNEFLYFNLTRYQILFIFINGIQIIEKNLFGGKMRGNVIVGQAGGPTAVINASLAGVISEAKKQNNIEKIYGMRWGIEGFLQEDLIDLSEFPQERIDRLKTTPGSALGSCRYKIQESDIPKVRSIFEKHNIRYFFYIGGNDTMDAINRIEKYCSENGYDVICVGIPKTVDNDLVLTDHTPGFMSAARYVASSVKQGGRLSSDMQKVDRFSIFQTVGRDAGWLAASSVLAGADPDEAPHLIYVPEKALNKDKVLSDVKSTVDRVGWVSIVVGEGIVWEDGSPVSASMVKDRFANVEFGAMGGTSAAMALHQIISNEFKFRGEFQIPESLQMCADDRVSLRDRSEAYDAGVEAVKQAAAGTTGKMITIQRKEGAKYEIYFDAAPLADIALSTKVVPDEYLTDNYVTEAFMNYVESMIEPLPDYEIIR
jgi:6-phosphofructokinase